MLIYVDTAFEKKQKEWLTTYFPGDQFLFRHDLPDEDSQREALLNADVILGNPKQLDWMEQAQQLKWIQLYSTGFEYFKHLHITAQVTNMQDYYSEPCAETILAGIMALYRGMNRFTLLKEKKKWVGQAMRTELFLLQNKKVIILGAGNIGKRMAKLLTGFDCKISYYARTAPEATIRNITELESAITDADIIIGCLPGTPETKGLFTTAMLIRMHPEALFCNVGRGNLVEDEAELVKALQAKKIGGAVLDVTLQEPLPADHAFWDCENVMLSQHSGGGNIEEFDGIARFFMENMERYKKGEPLKNVVELERGY